jgi:hypothetical protein
MSEPLDPHLFEGFVPIEDFARRCHRSRRTISKLIAQKDGLPCLSFGAQTLIHVEQAKAWFLSQVRSRNTKRQRA